MAVLGLRFCARAFSSCGKRGPLFIAVHGPLTVAASLIAEHRLQMRRLSNCGARDQLLRGMWDLPRPGLEPVSPALAGGLPATAPPGKPYNYFITPLGSSSLITVVLFFPPALGCPLPPPPFLASEPLSAPSFPCPLRPRPTPNRLATSHPSPPPSPLLPLPPHLQPLPMTSSPSPLMADHPHHLITPS